MARHIPLWFTLPLLTLNLAAQTAPPSNPSISTDEIDSPKFAAKVIANLDSSDPAKRRAAGFQLNNLGGAAYPLVKDALALPDLSAEARARLTKAEPILRARAAREERSLQNRKNIQARLRLAYSDKGKRNAVWDDQALRAIDLYAGPTSNTPIALAAFKSACDKGCKDPLILCLYHITVGEKFSEVESPTGTSFVQSIRALVDADYPPDVKFLVILNALTFDARLYPNAPKALPVLLKDMDKTSDLPRTLLDSLARHILGLEKFEGRRAFLEAYAAVAPDSPVLLAAQGERLIKAAWDARGSGFANTVTPEGWKAFYERLAEAENVLEKAWKADPTDPTAPTLMLTVKMGQGRNGGGREAMEEWFKRAMQADPDNVDACQKKLYYLYPRWYGSHEEMIAFGRECLQTGNWRGGVAYILLDAHDRVSQESPDVKEYFRQPAVWQDIHDVYEGHLANFPNDHFRRSQYAKFATTCDKWDVANEQFQILGDNVVVDVFTSQTSLNYLKKKAARLTAGG